MKSPEEKLEMMRQQVISKVRWGAQQQEVLDWLREKHSIVGPEAEQLFTQATRARTKRIRENALIRLVLSVLGIAGVAVFFATRFGMGVIVYGGSSTVIATVLVAALGWLSITTFIRSLAQLLTGEKAGPAD
ncbi:MAG: hypothetical protein SFY92_12185 [Verrucomicrobiae bacterium]|nr:hypothetical protein [Verrucomicrobiae bacterium]